RGPPIHNQHAALAWRFQCRAHQRVVLEALDGADRSLECQFATEIGENGFRCLYCIAVFIAQIGGRQCHVTPRSLSYQSGKPVRRGVLSLAMNTPSNPANSRITKYTRVHAGRLMPRKLPSTVAQLASPRNTMASTFCHGRISMRYPSPGPQAGTSLAGRCISHTCRAAMAAPANALIQPNTAYTRRPQPAGPCMAPSKQTSATPAMATRCMMHNGHG